jgi:hypothetical protein
MLVHAFRSLRLASIGLTLLLLLPSPLRAHCDALDGPVAAAALVALEKGDVSAVLKWVNADSEPEVRATFQKTLVVRSQGGAARELADRYFLETVVRLHRAGEGEGFTGLKPAGLDLGPAIAATDRALESGSVDAVTKLVADRSTAGIRSRFERALTARKHADESVEAGREYVAAYVDFIHYVDRLYEGASAQAGHAHEGHE